MSIGGLQLFWITDTGLLGGPKNVRNMGNVGTCLDDTNKRRYLIFKAKTIIQLQISKDPLRVILVYFCANNNYIITI